jgi:hypothetical protein
MSWLVTRRNAVYPYEPPEVIERLPAFTAEPERLKLM